MQLSVLMIVINVFITIKIDLFNLKQSKKLIFSTFGNAIKIKINKFARLNKL